MRLTKSVVDRARYEGQGRNFFAIWDETVPGFGLRVHPSEKKTFIVAYRTGGRKRIVKLGVYGQLTVEDARRLAKVELGAVAKGQDPAEVRRAARAQGLTVAELCEEYLERHAKVHKRSWRDDENRIRRTLVPEWGSRPVSSIKRDDVATLHRRIGGGEDGAPYEANRTLRLISKMWKLARDEWGYLAENAANPAGGIELFHEEKRDRFVKEAELPRLIEAIVGEPNPWIRGALTLYLLTGARKTELLAAKWDDVDLARRELRLPRTKANRVHFIALSLEACAVLHSLPREEGNSHLFPGHKTGSHLVNIEKSWRAIRKQSKLEDVRLHDLRRTVGSHLAADGASLPVIGRVLNHNNASTTAIYARLVEDVGRKPLEGLGAKIAALAGEHAEALGLVPAPIKGVEKTAAGA